MRPADAPAGGDDRVRVLVLGGWSPGPLDHLHECFSEQCIFYTPPLHMPPAGTRWCCTWECVLITAAIFLACFGPAHFAWSVAGVATLCCSIAALPFLIVLLVRGSIRRSVAAANSAITRHSIEVVVGFSCLLSPSRKVPLGICKNGPGAIRSSPKHDSIWFHGECINMSYGPSLLASGKHKGRATGKSWSCFMLRLYQTQVEPWNRAEMYACCQLEHSNNIYVQ